MKLASDRQAVPEVCQPVPPVRLAVCCATPSRSPPFGWGLDVLLVLGVAFVLLFLLFLLVLLLFVLFLVLILLFLPVVFKFAFGLDGFAAIDDAVLGSRGYIGDGVGTDHSPVLVQLDAAREGTGALRRRNGAARGDVLLLVVRVLFKLFVISIVQYLELLLNSISNVIPNVI